MVLFSSMLTCYSKLDDGSMRKDQREQSLDDIRNDDNIKVILISFKAGSTGLCEHGARLLGFWIAECDNL
jgi:hypothetical protein